MTGDELRGERSAELHAEASDHATVYQAGRDQHIEHHEHYEDGVRLTRRATSGSAADSCPYPGMDTFRPNQGEWFFGRDQLIALLLGRLDRRYQEDGGALIVVAPSGAGKSSLLQAGLMHQLKQGALPGSNAWPSVFLTPTEDPVGAIAAGLARFVGTDAAAVREQITADTERFAAELRTNWRGAVGADAGARTLLVVDQLEELFTLCEREEDRMCFLDLLSCLAEPDLVDGEPGVLVVYGLRADFYAQCATRSQLQTVLQDGQIVVGAMTPDQLREAIVYPARRAKLRVEPGLIEVLVRDLGVVSSAGGGQDTGGYEPGRLPLLAHALRATWRQREGSVLSVAGYRSTGGIESAVATGADEIFERLSDHEQALARTLFLRLIKIGDGVDDVRRRVSRADLLGEVSKQDQLSVAKVLDAFTEGRLLTQRQDTVEVTHEVLMRAWPALSRWIEEDRAGLQIEQNLLDAAQAWQQRERDPDALYRGVELAQASEWASRRKGGQWSPLGQEFLSTSIQSSRRRSRIKRAFVFTVITLLLLATGAATYGYQQRGDALELQQEILARGLIAQADAARATSPTLALRLALAAQHVNPSAEARSSLVTTLTGSSYARTLTSSAIGALAVSQDGAVLATTTNDSTFSLILWDFTDSRHPRETARVGGISKVLTFGPGRILVVIEMDDTVGIWTVEDPRQPRRLGRFDVYASAAAASFSPDGRTLAIRNAAGLPTDETLSLWDITNPSRPRQVGEIPTNLSYGVPFSARDDLVGTTASSADGEAVILWDTSEPNQPRELGQTPALAGVTTVAFSPDGRTMAVPNGRGSHAVTLWDVADPLRPRKLGESPPAHGNLINSMAFSRDGKTLASADDNGVVILWDTTNRAQFQQLGTPMTDHAGRALSVAFGNQGILASSGADGALILWDTKSRPRRLNQMRASAFSGDLRVLMSSVEEMATIWDLSSPEGPVVHGVLAGYVFTASHNGRTIFLGAAETADSPGPFEVWDISDPRRPRQQGGLGEEYPNAATFNHTGQIFVTAHSNGKIRVQAVASRLRQLAEFSTSLPEIGGVSTLVFSPGDQILAIGGHLAPEEPRVAQMVELWDLTNPQRPRKITGLPETDSRGISTMAFSVDGRTLAVLNADGDVTLWDVKNNAKSRVLSVVQASPDRGELDSLAVSINPAGTIMATSSSDGEVTLWNITDRTRPAKLEYRFTGHTDSIRDIGFNDSGDTMATLSWDGTAIYWGLAELNDLVDHAVARACDRVQRGLSREEWTHYVGTDYVQTCPTRM